MYLVDNKIRLDNIFHADLSFLDSNNFYAMSKHVPHQEFVKLSEVLTPFCINISAKILKK